MKNVLIDIMGTMVHTDLIKTLDVCFRQNGEEYIKDKEIKLVNKLKKELKTDDNKEIVTYIADQVASRNLNPNYIALMGEVNDQLYHDKTIVAPTFDDVKPNLENWKKQGAGLYVFSNGSAEEQQTILSHTKHGNLVKLFNDFYGTNDVGNKYAADNYKKIADRIHAAPSEIKFLSDVLKELDAADKAGMGVELIVRPGNKPVQANNYTPKTSFYDVKI